MTNEDEMKRMNAIHDVAEFLMPKLKDGRDCDEISQEYLNFKELFTLSERAGHNYMNDLKTVWTVLFKGRMAKELKVWSPFNEGDNSSDRKKRTVTQMLQSGIDMTKLKKDYKIKDLEIPYGLASVGSVAVSPLGLGTRATYHGNKTDYALGDSDLFFMWLWRNNISSFLTTHAKPGVAVQFDKYMELSGDLIQDYLIIAFLNESNSKHRKEVAKIPFPRPVLFDNGRHQVEPILGMSVVAGAVRVMSMKRMGEEEETDYYYDETISERELNKIFLEGTAAYVRNSLPEVREKTHQLCEHNDKIVKKLNDAFAKEIMLKQL